MQCSGLECVAATSVAVAESAGPGRKFAYSISTPGYQVGQSVVLVDQLVGAGTQYVEFQSQVLVAEVQLPHC